MKTNLNLLALGILVSLAGASFGQPAITTQPQSSTNDVGAPDTFWVAATIRRKSSSTAAGRGNTEHRTKQGPQKLSIDVEVGR